LHFDSKDAGTIKWTWRTQPAEAIYWKTYKPKKRDIKILSRVTPEQRQKVTKELHQDIIQNEHPPKTKQAKVRTL
jgi:Spy/CpxP family protein refolding chaperone